MKRNKGFTLIELLAVIVILAIIALIATPIVLNIINDSKESANLQSAEFYLGAVETAVAKKIIDDPTFRPKSCEIQSDGNLKCDEKDVKVEINGEVPTSGTITLLNGKIQDVELVLSEKTIVKNSEGKLDYIEKSNLLYKIGDIVTFNPGDGDKTWNVIRETEDTVTLMMTQNLGGQVKWSESYVSSEGPSIVLNYLNSLTVGWENVDPITDFVYINNLNGNTKQYGYEKIEIIDGVAKITNNSGTVTTISNESKARLLTVEELFEIASKSNSNFTEENLRGYITRNLEEINVALGSSATTVEEVIESYITSESWLTWLQKESKYLQLYETVSSIKFSKGIEETYSLLLPEYLYKNLTENEFIWGLSTCATDFDNAWGIQYNGLVGSRDIRYDVNNGIRPIITIPKSKLK